MEMDENQTKNPSFFLQFLAKFHAGYFRISMSLCGQALLWKILKQPIQSQNSLRKILQLLPNSAFLVLWSLTLLILVSLSLIYILRCFFHFKLVKFEFLHRVGVNYLFAPWISWLLLLQSSPFKSFPYEILMWVFLVPIVILDVKIYGQWFIKGKRFLSTVANPTSQLSVIGNLAGARTLAVMGWRETSLCMFSLGMSHYLVLFVTLYQRLAGSNSLPAILRPVFFLFFAVPSMASLAWSSITKRFDTFSKILFFVSVFLFVSLVSRPMLFRKCMRKFTVAWWSYSFPLSLLALACNEYAKEVGVEAAHVCALLLALLSLFVSLFLLILTVLRTNSMIPMSSPEISSDSSGAEP
ncbi:S-type anion channel SLAH1-like [Cucurbita pepo subsp. pepo]|uniref:S-type anion channel SLAH1-like n=1 Tax=Cucurbita pepo subsp. pepo TaxID=3664 RepID=UPI000C9D5E9D|nr:S-type anion channel SLAH1-like [Cucurbita pepo subsp. pepo]